MPGRTCSFVKGVVSLGSMLFSMKERILEMFVQMLKKAAWKIPIQLIAFYLQRRQAEQIKILVVGIWNDAKHMLKY